MAKIVVQNTEVNVVRVDGEDYICLTDMIKAKDGDFFITDWLLLPAEITREQASHVYADEADVLNVAMFGKLLQSERLIKLNQIAIHQMQILESGDNDRKLLK